ncbi:hypothetical protein M9435_004970 [Picochlorum sp. BPE23]|nr:hypothetical protein M9435_004970 [Picochlorum sp. BPE23]
MGQCFSQGTKEDSMGDQGLLSFGPMAMDAPTFEGDCKVDVRRPSVKNVTARAKETQSNGIGRQRRRVAVAAQGIHSLTDEAIAKYPKTTKVVQMLLGVMDDNMLFQGLSLAAKQAIVESMSPQYVESGCDVIRQGDLDGQEFYVVEKGRFCVTKRVEREGKEDIVVLGNDFGTSFAFGDLALLYDAPRSATVTATSSGKLWKMERHVYQAIKHAHSKQIEVRKSDAIQSIPLLRSLPLEQKSLLCEAMVLEEFMEGDFIVTQGDVGSMFYMIDEGTVEVLVDGEVVTSLSKGSYFGERALIRDDVRSADVRCSTATVACFTITREVFNSLFSSLEHAWVYSVLRNVSVLSALTDEQMLQVSKAMEPVHMAEGQTIFNVGDAGDAFYIIEKGICKLIASNGQVLAECSEGHCFGEKALLTDAPRAASAVAWTDVSLLRCGRETFEEHLGNLKTLMTIWKVKALSKVPLLQHVGQNGLEDMCEKLQEETFEDGDLICKEGDVGDSFYILQSGTCVVIKAQGTGHKAIARLEPGQYFGEIALLRDDPRTATIKATSPVKLLVLKREHFFDVVKDFYQALTMKIGKIDAQDSGHSHLPSKLCPGDLKILKTLGHGAFGKVYLVRCRHNNMKYALKCIKKEKVIASKLTEHVVREKQVMEHLQSPFLVSLAASFQDRRHLYMLMRLAEGGELFNYLSNRSSSLSENEAKFYAGCVVMGLDYLHERGVSWRDLKPENILLDISGYAVLTDFGFAKMIPTGSKSFTMCGTPEYLAPEMILQSGHNHAVDWWSLGILIFEMVAGKPPFCDEDRVTMFKSITNISYRMPSHFSWELQNLISSLLVKTPSKRLGYFGAAAIKSHPWFSGFDWDALSNRDLTPPYIPPAAAHTNSEIQQSDSDSSPFEESQSPVNYGQFARAFEDFDSIRVGKKYS